MTDVVDNTTTELKHILSAETMQRLGAESTRLQIPLKDLVRDAIEEYLEILEDTPEDTSDEEILEDLRQALYEAKTGQTIPARQVIEELRRE